MCHTCWLKQWYPKATEYFNLFLFVSGGLPPEGKIKQPLLVTTAHMHWDPEYSDVKLIQTMMLMSELKKVVEESHQVIRPESQTSGQTVDCNSIPMILCGDLNSLPESGIWCKSWKSFNDMVVFEICARNIKFHWYSKKKNIKSFRKKTKKQEINHRSKKFHFLSVICKIIYGSLK